MRLLDLFTYAIKEKLRFFLAYIAPLIQAMEIVESTSHIELCRDPEEGSEKVPRNRHFLFCEKICHLCQTNMLYY